MMRGVIVGFGEVARHGHWPAYAASHDLQIAAVVDPDEARRRMAAELIAGVRTYATLAEVDQTLQFADVCTPPAMHQPHVLESLARGWHVLCEKPFVLRSDLLSPVREAAERRELAVVPVHNWKYAPILRRATALLEQGSIGALRRVEITTLRTQAAATAGGDYNWRHDPLVAGGGILMDHGWHALYLAQHWFNEPPAAIAGELVRPDGGGVETAVDLRIGFASGEARVILSWNAGVRRNSVRLAGETGELVADDDRLIVTGSRALVEPFAAPLSAGSHHADWFTAMLPDVVDCFRAPGRARRLLDEAEQCIRLIEQAYAGSAEPVR